MVQCLLYSVRMPICAVFGCFESTSKEKRSNREEGNGEECAKDGDAAFRASEEYWIGIATQFNNSEPFEKPLCISPFIKYFAILKSELGKRWKIAGGRAVEDYTIHATFCSKHFTKDLFQIDLLEKRKFILKPGVRILKDDAIPTLHLPGSRPRLPSQLDREKRMSQKRSRCGDYFNLQCHAFFLNTMNDILN